MSGDDSESFFVVVIVCDGVVGVAAAVVEALDGDSDGEIGESDNVIVSAVAAGGVRAIVVACGDNEAADGGVVGFVNLAAAAASADEDGDEDGDVDDDVVVVDDVDVGGGGGGGDDVKMSTDTDDGDIAPVPAVVVAVVSVVLFE
jgi:hypothetical protein